MDCWLVQDELVVDIHSWEEAVHGGTGIMRGATGGGASGGGA